MHTPFASGPGPDQPQPDAPPPTLPDPTNPGDMPASEPELPPVAPHEPNLPNPTA